MSFELYMCDMFNDYIKMYNLLIIRTLGEMTIPTNHVGTQSVPIQMALT